MLTDAERAELTRQFEAARVMAACPPLGPISPEEAVTYGLSPEEVAEANAEWTQEGAQAAFDHCQVRLSLFTKLLSIVDPQTEPLATVVHERGTDHRRDRVWFDNEQHSVRLSKVTWERLGQPAILKVRIEPQ